MKSAIYRAFSIIVSLVVVGFAILAVGHFARVGAQGQSYSVLYNFQGAQYGATPYGGLLLDSNGDLFGTTFYQQGGAPSGVVFELGADDSYTVLHAFKVSDGAGPMASLISDPAGNLYGTTSAGGSSGYGTVFRVTLAGQTKVVHSFSGGTGDGMTPEGPLATDKSGNGYGTTVWGGSNGAGTIYKVNGKNSQVTILHSFQGFPSDGGNPAGGLILDSSGNLYGTTPVGGSSNCGTLFEVTPAGVETVLHNFTGTDGCDPHGSLLRNAAGDLYTTTVGGGANNLGAIVKWSENGKIFVLYSFGGSDGENPYASLIRDSSGDFFGTTYNGGANGLGVVFEFSNTQQYTVLHSFSGGTTDGANPYAPLVRDSSGNLYGTTVNGGTANCTYGCGTIFKITP